MRLQYFVFNSLTVAGVTLAVPNVDPAECERNINDAHKEMVWKQLSYIC